MKWLVRAVFVIVIALGAVVAACTSFSEDDVTAADAEAGPAPTTTAPTVMDAAVDADADAPADAAPCEPDDSDAGTVTIRPQGRDAVLDPKEEDAGARRLCDVSAAVCLIAFDLGSKAARPVHDANLVLKRAVGNDCESPTDCGQHRTGGTVEVHHMRADWTERATYKLLSAGGGPWGAAGALGTADIAAGVGSDLLAMNDDANITLPPELLDARFLPQGANHLLAFRVSTPGTVQFVIRRSEYAVASAPDLATLHVRFCKP